MDKMYHKLTISNNFQKKKFTNCRKKFLSAPALKAYIFMDLHRRYLIAFKMLMLLEKVKNLTLNVKQTLHLVKITYQPINLSTN